jgi:hypothetical protein
MFIFKNLFLSVFGKFGTRQQASLPVTGVPSGTSLAVMHGDSLPA